MTNHFRHSCKGLLSLTGKKISCNTSFCSPKDTHSSKVPFFNKSSTKFFQLFPSRKCCTKIVENNPPQRFIDVKNSAQSAKNTSFMKNVFLLHGNDATQTTLSPLKFNYYNLFTLCFGYNLFLHHI